MDAAPAPSLPQLHSTLTSLQTATHILAGLTHRNKNQHRGTKWWPAFNMLRRSLQKLMLDLEAAIQRAEVFLASSSNSNSSSSSSKKQKQKQKQKQGAGSTTAVAKPAAKRKQPELDRVVDRAVWMRDVLAGRAYEAFTQLTAERQFAQLGLVLIGVLAQVEATLAPFAGQVAAAESRHQPDDESRGKLPAQSSTQQQQGVDVPGHKGRVAGSSNSTDNAAAATATTVAGGDLDLGVAVSRAEVGYETPVRPSVEEPVSSPIPTLPSTKAHHGLGTTMATTTTTGKWRKSKEIKDDEPTSERPVVKKRKKLRPGDDQGRSEPAGSADTVLDRSQMESRTSKKPKLDDAPPRTRGTSTKTAAIPDESSQEAGKLTVTTKTMMEMKENKEKKKKTKKTGGKKGGDAFDDLFSSLL